AKPEYTGVVAGMSGSPVYVDGKLLGALSYRIGQFSKDPIAGITPIEQMLEVRNLPMQSAGPMAAKDAENGTVFAAMETPLPMTSTDEVTTLASPLNAFKIVNTGNTIGAFTEDRDAAIRGELGAKARMIPVSMTIAGTEGAPGGTVERHVELADLPALTPSAV